MNFVNLSGLCSSSAQRKCNLKKNTQSKFSPWRLKFCVSQQLQGSQQHSRLPLLLCVPAYVPVNAFDFLDFIEAVYRDPITLCATERSLWLLTKAEDWYTLDLN